MLGSPDLWTLASTVQVTLPPPLTLGPYPYPYP